MAIKLYIFNPREFYKLTRKKFYLGGRARVDLRPSAILQLASTDLNANEFYFRATGTAFSALYNQEMDSWNFWIFFC